MYILYMYYIILQCTFRHSWSMVCSMYIYICAQSKFVQYIENMKYNHPRAFVSRLVFIRFLIYPPNMCRTMGAVAFLSQEVTHRHFLAMSTCGAIDLLLPPNPNGGFGLRGHVYYILLY